MILHKRDPDLYYHKLVVDNACVVVSFPATHQDWKAQKQAERENTVAMRDAAAPELLNGKLLILFCTKQA